MNRHTRRRFSNNSSSAQVNLIRYTSNLISSIIMLETPLPMMISGYLIVLIPIRVLGNHRRVTNSKVDHLPSKHSMVIHSLCLHQMVRIAKLLVVVVMDRLCLKSTQVQVAIMETPTTTSRNSSIMEKIRNQKGKGKSSINYHFKNRL